MEKQMKLFTNMAKPFVLFVLLFAMGLGEMRAELYIVGSTSLTGHNWDYYFQCSSGQTASFKTIAAGTHFFKVANAIDGKGWSTTNCIDSYSGSTISSAGKQNDGDAMYIALTDVSDIDIVATGTGYQVTVTATKCGYYLKYPWGESHAWTWSSALTDCGNGVYACTGPYNGTTYDYGRRNSDGGAGGAAAVTGATTVNSPSLDDKCVFELTYSTGALRITRCNQVNNGNHVYFDNSVSGFTGTLYLVIGHDKPTAYSKVYALTPVAGTSLYHVDLNSDVWTDVTYYAVIGSVSDASTLNGDYKWGSSSLSSKGDGGYTAAYTGNYDLNGTSGSYKTFLITTASSGNGKEMTITYQGSGYNDVQKVNATQAAKKRDTGTTYSAITGSNAWPATLKLEGSYMKNATDTARSTITSTTSGDGDGYKTYGVIKTGTVTQSYTSLNASYHFEGWGVNSETTPSNTDATYEYNITAATTVYAFFSKLYTLTYATKGEDTGSSLSVYDIDDYSGSTTSGSSIPTGHMITLVATPATGYEVEGWYSDASCEIAYTSGSGDVTIEDNNTFKLATINANTEVYCKFQPKTYTINLEDMEPSTAGQGSVSVTYNASTNMTASDEVTKPTKNNYDFGGYWVRDEETKDLVTQLIDADGKWIADKTGYTSHDGSDNPTWVHDYAISLYAKWTETAYAITPSVSPAGAGSVNTVTDAHIITASSTITATPVNAAWIFDYWTCGTNVGIAEGKGTGDNPVTVTASQNSTITANFKHRYNLLGSKYEEGKGKAEMATGGMPGWTYGSGADFTINSYTADGDNATVDLSYTCTLDAGTYIFEIHDRQKGESLGRKGDGGGVYALTDGSSVQLRGGTDKDQSIFFYPQHAGQYTFRITYMTKDGNYYYPTVTIERPHQLHFGTGYAGIDNLSSVTSGTTGGTLAVTTSAGSLSNEDWVTYGTDVTYTPSAATGYTFEGFYSSNEYSDRFTQNNPWVHYNVTGDDNVYAKFEEKSTSVTLANDGNGKVQISSTDKANTTVGITTSREITAVPNTGYSFSSWTVPGGADFSVESTSSATTTLSGLGAGTAGTLTANFTENMHAVTVKAGSGGSVSSDPALSDGKVTIGITTSATLTATPANAAWVFKNWTGDIDDGITIASGSATSATITINATADSKSITANFEPRYGLHGSLANDTPGGMPGWAGDGADFAVSSFSGIGEGDGKGVDLRCARTLEPNKEYKFRIYDRAADGRWGYSSSVTLGAGESLTLSTYGDVSGKDVKIYTVGYGTYTFKITNMYDNSDGKYYPKVTVDRPTSYQFNMGCTEGGTVTAATTAGSGYAITNGQYVAAGDDIQFHAVPAAGYAFDHWYTASDYATSFNDNKDMKMNNISETVNAYAKFVPVAVTFTNNSGSGDGKWSTASNWSPACVPTIDHDVVITKPVTVDIAHATAKSIVLDQNSHTGKLTIQANKGLEVLQTIKRTTDGSNRLATREEDLVLESSSAGNASLIFDNSNSDAATVMMYSKATIVGNTWNWQYVGTPFTGSIPQYNYYGSWMYKWNNGWDVVHGGDELDPFAGYCLTQNSATTHVMGGTLVPTTSSGSISVSGDVVLANSWTAPIWIGGFTASTFTSSPATIYLFNTGMAEDGSNEGTEAGTYVTVPVKAADYTGDEFIAPMQGFFVTNYNGTSGSITLNYNDLVRPAGKHTGIVAGPMYAKKQEIKPKVMKIRANGTQYSDRVVILAREDFSEGFDNGWDGEKLSFGAEAPSVYVINEQGGYDAVSAIPGFEGTLVGFRAGTNNSCTMTFEYDGEEIWYLNDLQTQQSTLIDSELTYTFSTSSYDNEARFIISATPIRKITTGNESVGAEAAKVRKLIINDKLYIIRGGRMYSVDGAMIK